MKGTNLAQPVRSTAHHRQAPSPRPPGRGHTKQSRSHPRGGALNELFLPLAVGCAVALVSALMVVLARRPVHSVVALLAHSLSLAALYLILGADMVAMGQILIYSGAIVVLFLFVVALLPQGGVEGFPGGGRVLGAIVAGG